ncbi:GAF domain-containing protein [Flammeovirga pectinis]|uniref:GAF domain-containing protein n=1 Tax=Flammeovirga pectinis TaxID=2494373 RepID=A0A3Q9FVJ8_9BACT|nr:GAF domain-containing protein [Flammeovirga pectinis]AZQ65537.1 GAF domain-containing protein [Flammeovirga pectinis]
MIKPETPQTEKVRLEDLASYDLINSIDKIDYQNIAKIAAQICNTSISMISVIESEKQWFKGTYGIEATEGLREMSFCGHALNNPGEIMIVEDARLDERFYDNPFVVEDPHVLFYAGVPLVTNKGNPLGTICVIDNKPNKLTIQQQETLMALSSQVMRLFELRKKNYILEELNNNLNSHNVVLEKFIFQSSEDILGPMNSIESLANLLSLYRIDDPQILQIIDNLQKSVDDLRNLMDGLKNYQSN